MKLILRLLINALALLVITQILEGFIVDGLYAAIIAAIILGLLNAIIRPVLLILTLPVNILTLGLFTFIINGFLIWFAGTFLQGFTVANFWTAVLAGIMLWLVGLITNAFIHDSK